FHQIALAHPAFRAGATTVNFIPRYLDEQLQELASTAQGKRGERRETLEIESVRMFTVEVNGRRFDVRVAENGAEAMA
ncbi:hypothetical protein WFJ45_22780, partial [Salmonella enterica subsp. enterica serovar Minnesota]